MNSKPVLLFIYNSFKDPLFQNLLFSYINEIQAGSNCFSFHVVTFEQVEYKVEEEEKAIIINELSERNIFWHPLEYHTGRFMLAKKVWDMCAALVLVNSLTRKHRIRLILAFANVAAAFSYLLTKLFNLKLLIYSYEPHSELMAELGVWNRKSMRYQLLKLLENKAGEQAEVIMTGTKYMVEKLYAKGVQGKVLRVPTGVDEKLYHFNAVARTQLRQQLSIESYKVILYMGKFGDLYYKEEVVAFFSGLYQKDPSFYFVVITRHPHSQVHNWFKKYNIPETNYHITGNLSNKEIKDYLSAADIGISAVPPSPSQKYRSPTKVGEYLMCGLPYITCQGVSEDDIYALVNKVGVVVQEFSVVSAMGKADEINSLLKEGGSQLRERCRSVGIEYRSKYKVVQLIEEQLKLLQ
jgi:hypothetical protein